MRAGSILAYHGRIVGVKCVQVKNVSGRGGKVADRIKAATLAEDKGIRAPATGQCIMASTAIDNIVTVVANDHIVQRIARSTQAVMADEVQVFDKATQLVADRCFDGVAATSVFFANFVT